MWGFVLKRAAKDFHIQMSGRIVKLIGEAFYDQSDEGIGHIVNSIYAKHRKIVELVFQIDLLTRKFVENYILYGYIAVSASMLFRIS